MKIWHIFVCSLVLLPACREENRYLRWGKDVFYQSEKQFSYRAFEDTHIRSLRIYDQLTTLGLFDALWLSKEVRTLYSKEQAALYGYNQERYDSFLEKQLDESNKEIGFYILASMPHAQDLLLTDETSPWTLYLRVNGESYAPKKVTVVDLPTPYQKFFGKRYSSARKIYYVSFSAQKEDGSVIITSSTSSLSLCFHMIGNVDECVAWKVRPSVECCSNNPNMLAYDM